MTDDVRTQIEAGIGRITLTRPRALHSLTTAMCEAINEALLAWRDNDTVRAVAIDHEDGTRGFCAGGDVAMVRRSALEDGGEAGRAFFFHEYRMNHLLFTYPKPTVAFMDGVTMGGGVGLSQPCDFRVATQNTMFAMPEGSIGLFPDVGAGHYLPRLPGETGKFLALTAARLDGAECLWAGLATHYLAQDGVAEAKRRMMSGEEIDAVLGDLAIVAPEPRIAGNAESIDKLFAPAELEAIIDALAGDSADWAAKELKAVQAKCPMTGKVALRQFAQNAQCTDFAANMAMEYRVASRMMMRHDFAEGVRAVLIDKDNAPAWKPDRPEDISATMLDDIFAPLGQGEEWTPFG
ncbi:enoyl-CoA hydratase/isomerase family protein [Aurantiacibacter spongiae]|uniref:3-hydroxyisobutyryl-CoA hydrolase n=1 Tax=Aurantiacibacter spongiae TaxID=2488860 RepID=A0A3N5CRK9_9SPHN|nr:enoyl-CoA hydratase/isomerase family protein [Aurantiacibacter spongiae]RPF70976.1 enoyl-CoA hydratase/isomerase family protein [Aurantiacibacter spongiae]